MSLSFGVDVVADLAEGFAFAEDGEGVAVLVLGWGEFCAVGRIVLKLPWERWW